MRVLVPLTLPEAQQVIEALGNRVASMQHRATIGRVTVGEVSAPILDCHAAETALREAFGPLLAEARTPDAGDHHVYPVAR